MPADRLGVVAIVFAPKGPAPAAAEAARLGFSHIDLTVGADHGLDLPLPIVDRFSLRPQSGCSSGAPPEGGGRWERAVRAFRAAPGSRIEPWPGSIINSVEKVKAFLAEAPETTLLLDTGHVAAWGEDPAELLPFATHIQLRQARRGEPQTITGDVDFAAFFARANAVGYRGAYSIEYFDLPDLGWPLADPVAHAVALADEVRALLRTG